MSMSIGLSLARAAGRLPRGSRHFIPRIAARFPELQSLPVETRHGQLFCDLREAVCNQLFRNGGYKHTLVEEAFLANVVRPGDVVFDVGANVGYMAIQFAKVAKMVHLFEPAPRAVRLLRKTVSLYPNMVLHETAVSDRAGVCGFREEASLDVSHVAEEGIQVQAITLDSLNIQPAFIKIDVEGHERSVLLGAKKILENGPKVYFEALSKEALEENEEVLLSANPLYRVKQIAPGNRNYLATIE